MKSGSRLIGNLLLAGALGCCGIGSALPAAAQNIRDTRINLYPIGKQVGIVTDVSGATAWARMPKPVRVGDTIEFMAYSDSGDVLASGQVRWASPVAPYEALIGLIKPTVARHPVSDFDDDFIIGPISKRSVPMGTLSDNEPFGFYLAVGFFARAVVAPRSEDRAAREPVRAFIEALRALNNKTATDMAAAAERALVADPSDPDTPADEAVNYTDLSANLRRFHRMDISDTIEGHILHRLDLIAQANGGDGSKISKEILRTSTPINDQLGMGGGYSTAGR
jgi:hypothetical protein